MHDAINFQHAELFQRLQKIHSHFDSYLGFGLTEVDEINSRTYEHMSS